MAEAHVTVKLTLMQLPESGRCRSRIDESPSGASHGPGNDFDLPKAPAIGFSRFLKECQQDDVEAVKKLTEFGRKLYSDAFANSVGEAFAGARAHAASQGAYLRLAISAQTPSLLELPWEFLHDSAGFLLQQSKLHLVRVLDDLPHKMASFRPITRVLVAVANPPCKTKFDPKEHLRRLREILESMGVAYIERPAATRDVLWSALEEEEFDTFYFLGHGRLHLETGGEIILDDGEALPATDLAQRLGRTRRPVHFAYFNSCDTGATIDSNTFSGVAQRVLANGSIPAVLAQQAPVKAVESMRVAEAVLRRVRAGESPETAIAFARSEAKGVAWGIPVLYTHLRGPEEFERNRIACLLGTEVEKGHHGIVLSSFGMGILIDGQGDMVALGEGCYELPAHPKSISVKVIPPETFVYPGSTYARDDVGACGDVQKLLMRVANPTQINLHSSTEDPEVTHWYLFGSRSNKRVAAYLKNYASQFNFQYGDKEWRLEVLDDKGQLADSYSVVAPHRLGHRAYAETDDYGIIEKISDSEHRRVYFIIAGLGSRATRGCGWYLLQRWEELLQRAGGSDFGAVIKCPANSPYTAASLLRLKLRERL